MIFYAIKKISTGEFLPHFGKRRGHTRAEPTKDKPPRLFKTYNNAKGALNWWIQGIWSEINTTNYYGEGDTDLKNYPQDNRKKEDMKIVKIILSEKK